MPNNDFDFIIKTCDICMFKLSNFCLKNGFSFSSDSVQFLVCSGFEFNKIKLNRLYGIDTLELLKKEVC